MNLNHLLYFRVLARTEHYGRASQELYISQPSLSYAISTLERELGTRLFEKKGRNVTLTKYGKFYAEKVDNTFRELEDAENKLRRMTGCQGGHIDLSYYHTLGINFVPSIIKAYLSRIENTQVSFTLRQQSSHEMVNGLLQGKHDLGFCTYVDHEKYPDIETTPVKKDYFHLIVPSDHYLAGEKKISIYSINDCPYVAFSQNSGLRAVIDNILTRWQIVPNVVFEAEQGSTVAGIVAAGLGISLIPDIPLPDMDIVKIPLEEPVEPRITYLAYSKNHFRTEILQSFHRFVVEQCGYCE